MKELTKIAVFAIVALVLSPLLGFGIVALIGVALFLLPVGAVVSTIFPKTWKHVDDTLLSSSSLLPTA
ncbi:MAG: hypothetical protein HGB05_18565 [Chloroflexi bacterium]|nr:hypothetical protein [Chloroflexota bacterium]